MRIVKGLLLGGVCFIPVVIVYWIVRVENWHMPGHGAIGVDVVKLYTIQSPIFWSLFVLTMLLAFYLVRPRHA
mgnify:CR=1 FL=1